jgi:hypothetical protein
MITGPMNVSGLRSPDRICTTLGLSAFVAEENYTEIEIVREHHEIVEIRADDFPIR